MLFLSWKRSLYNSSEALGLFRLARVSGLTF
jgi:hypothetical protein